MKKWIVLLTAILMLCAVLSGCSQSADTSSNSAETVSVAESAEIQVFAAASLTEALNKIIEDYKTVAPNVTIITNYDSSGTLQTQIENGAGADIFISAAQKQMDNLAENYILTTSRKELLVNKVVLIVPNGSTKGITSFNDVATSKVSLVALGNYDVPVGQYSEEIFKYLTVWEEIQSKISFGSNVKEVLSQVSSGSVDCGVVYATDAATSADAVTVVTEAPQGSHKAVVYSAAVLKASENQADAQVFLDFLSSEKAVSDFESVGFKMAS